MNYKLWITIAGRTIEAIVFVPKEKAEDLEQFLDDHAADLISEHLEIKYAPVRGS